MMRWSLAVVLAVGLASPAQAVCRMALALGLDVSSSVDAREYRLQLDGLANALMDTEVQQAIFAMSPANVRFMIYEWGDAARQRVLVDWVEATEPADVARIAATLRSTVQLDRRDSTGLGTAIVYGGRALQSQAECWQLTLDVSGDGQNNDGPEPELLHNDPALARVTVNALVIGSDARHIGGADRRHAEIKELLSYFASRVITGPLAFTEAALTFDDFEAAMRRKLLRELAGMAVSDTGGPATQWAQSQ